MLFKKYKVKKGAPGRAPFLIPSLYEQTLLGHTRPLPQRKQQQNVNKEDGKSKGAIHSVEILPNVRF